MLLAVDYETTMLRVDRVIVDDVLIVEGTEEGTCMYVMGTVAVWNHQQLAETTQAYCYTSCRVDQ